MFSPTNVFRYTVYVAVMIIVAFCIQDMASHRCNQVESVNKARVTGINNYKLASLNQVIALLEYNEHLNWSIKANNTYIGKGMNTTSWLFSTHITLSISSVVHFVHEPSMHCYHIKGCLTYGWMYSIKRNIDSDFNLVIWRSHEDRQINLCHYRSIYTTSMGFSPYSNNIHQFKILPTAFSEQTAKYNVRLYFCLYGSIH